MTPRGWLVFFAIGAVLAVGVPLLNALPSGSALQLPDYLVPLLGKYACFALLALALDLVWGYAGILSLGHGAFFALGGYAMGMHLMRRIGTRGVYRDPVLPDFMVFLNWKQLPWYWYGFDHFAFAAAMVVLVPGLLAFVFGWFAFRSRVTGVYLSIITQALTYALLLAFFRNDMGFGGNNGLTDFKDLLGFDLHAPATRSGLYIASVIALGLGYLVTGPLVASLIIIFAIGWKGGLHSVLSWKKGRGEFSTWSTTAQRRQRTFGTRSLSYRGTPTDRPGCPSAKAPALYLLGLYPKL